MKYKRAEIALLCALNLIFISWALSDSSGLIIEINDYLITFIPVGLFVTLVSAVYLGWLLGVFIGSKIIGPLIINLIKGLKE